MFKTLLLFAGIAVIIYMVVLIVRQENRRLAQKAVDLTVDRFQAELEAAFRDELKREPTPAEFLALMGMSKQLVGIYYQSKNCWPSFEELKALVQWDVFRAAKA